MKRAPRFGLVQIGPVHSQERMTIEGRWNQMSENTRPKAEQRRIAAAEQKMQIQLVRRQRDLSDKNWCALANLKPRPRLDIQRFKNLGEDEAEILYSLHDAIKFPNPAFTSSRFCVTFH